MKNNKVKIVLFVLFFIVVVYALYCIIKLRANTEIELSLNALQHNGEYQYNEIEWGSAIDELREIAPFTLKEDTSRASAQESSPVYKFYKAEKQFLLDGQKGEATFEFQDSELRVIQFTFSLEGNNDEWFDAQAEQLGKMYGEASEKLENTSAQFRSMGYKWETGSTTLQIVRISGSNLTVVISLGSQ